MTCRSAQGDQEILPEAAWHWCCVHFLRNALDYLPRKANDDCLQELPNNSDTANACPPSPAVSHLASETRTPRNQPLLPGAITVCAGPTTHPRV